MSGRRRPRQRFNDGARAAGQLEKLEQHERRARTAEDELRSVGARYHEDIEMMAAIAPTAPFVPRIEAAL